MFILIFRSLGLNTVTAYQRAKVQALKIVNLRIGGGSAAQRQRTLSEAPVFPVRNVVEVLVVVVVVAAVAAVAAGV